MKKTITSIAAILLFAGISNAAATTEKTTVAVENKAVVSAVASMSLSQLIDENIMLRTQLEKVNEEADNLQSKLAYTGMMHSTISNLQQLQMSKAAEDAKDQLEYARMMNATLVALSAQLAK